VPTGADADAMLKQHLTPLVARFRAGESAYYRALASNDPWITEAIRAFEKAATLKPRD